MTGSSTVLSRSRAGALVGTLLLVAALAAAAAQRPAFGSAWTRSPVAVPHLSSGAVPHLDPGLPTVGAAVQRVVVSGRAGVAAAAAAVERVGGRVGRRLEIIGGVSATVPADRLVPLSRDAAVGAVTADRRATFSDVAYDPSALASNYPRTTGATSAWSKGNLGAGVGVAVLDTGVSAMNDLAGRVVYGPDLSGEGTTVDSYGHGTVMAGAIGGNGRDSIGTPGGAYVGAAPRATLVSVKVAGRNGAVDVSTMLQGMHWVSAYKDQFNIRVLNLSWGTPSTQDPAVDPINYAVERLWRQGIVVVVAAGNSGPNPGTVTKPGDDPLVLTVGAYDDKGDLVDANDAVPAWSSRGPTARGLSKPDLVTPGRSLVTTRSYGSNVEANNPQALVSPSYIRGSGTSQAAAVTSGVVALLLAARPELTPDQVKAVLTATARPIGARSIEQGAGRIDLAAALTAAPGPAVQQSAVATGLGSLELSRGGRNVETVCPGRSTTTVIRGEIDVRCEPWTGSTWTGSTWTGSTWTGSTWTGSTWTNAVWTGSTWTGGQWTGSTWTGTAWTGSTWTGSTWTGSTWTGSTWTGSTWTGSTWTGSTWTTAEYDEAFLNAFWGSGPPPGRRLPGEVTRAVPGAGL